MRKPLWEFGANVPARCTSSERQIAEEILCQTRRRVRSLLVANEELALGILVQRYSQDARAASSRLRRKFCAKQEGESAVCSSQMRNSPIAVRGKIYPQDALAYMRFLHNGSTHKTRYKECNSNGNNCIELGEYGQKKGFTHNIVTATDCSNTVGTNLALTNS